MASNRLKDGATRKDTKVALTRLLFERGYRRDEVVRLFNIIDWMIQLPEGLEPAFIGEVQEIQEEKKMAYVNTIERHALAKGRQEGEAKGRIDTLRKLIELKFNEVPEWADQRLQQASQDELNQWVEQILSADTLEALLNT